MYGSGMRFDPQSNYIPTDGDLPAPLPHPPPPRRRRFRLRWIIVPIWLLAPLVGGYFVLQHVMDSFSVSGLIEPEQQELLTQLQSISKTTGNRNVGQQKASLEGAMSMLESLTSGLRDGADRLTKSPGNAKSLESYEAGRRLAAMGRHRESLPHFIEAIRLDPDFADAHYKLAISYMHAGSPDAARREQARLEEIDPDLASLLSNLTQ